MSLLSVEQLFHRGANVKVPRLDVLPGEILAVVGPSGAGKTTLLRMLNLLDPPDGGQIHFRGERVTDVNRLTVQRQMCLVTQKTVMFNTTVTENLTYGLRVRGKALAPAVADGWLARIGLQGFGPRPARTLSGGEAQRLAVARAALLRPSVLLLDEPTANLDPANVGVIEELVLRLNQEHGTAIVLVTHNLFQARRLATRGAYMESGEIMECGGHLFQSPRTPQAKAFLGGQMVY